MAAISELNPKAEVARAAHALQVNIAAAKGLQEVLKTNLGPKGTLKMLVSGAGDIKITKDGNVLLHEMQIRHPTAALIAKVSTAQDDISGDGTTTTVMLIGEFLRQAELYTAEGLHPRILTEGFETAKDKALEVLERLKIPLSGDEKYSMLTKVAATSLQTKIAPKLAEQLTSICVDAVLSLEQQRQELDLAMIEVMAMRHQTQADTSLVRGLVLDHGARHPDMPRALTNCHILTCNVSLEYEKTEVNSSFFYKTAAERDKLVDAERDYIQERVRKAIAFKKRVCDNTDKTFVMLNMKGIDPIALDALAQNGIMALRRTKRRNMERLALACGGCSVNSFDDLDESVLGFAGRVYEHQLGEDKFTFVEECREPRSVTILLKGASRHAIAQMKDAVRDGLRAVSNAIDDAHVVPGAGACELAAHLAIRSGLGALGSRERLGAQAYADSLLVIPKSLAQNAGHDQQEVIAKLLAEAENGGGPVGVDCATGEPIDPVEAGILDNYNVKKQVINSCTVIASNVLLVDEIMRAGLASLKPGQM